MFTGILMEEAGRCYMNGANYATLAMCQAVAESVLRRKAEGSEIKYWRLLKRLHTDGLLTTRQKDDLIWLSKIRNPTLHTGSYEKYANALARVLIPVIENGKITERTPIESDCRRALRTIIGLLHILCPEPPEPDFLVPTRA